eukprot:673115-Amphidinium_carterae.1
MRVICRYYGIVAPYSSPRRLASLHARCRDALTSSSSLHSAAAHVAPSLPPEHRTQGSNGLRDIVPLVAPTAPAEPHAT